MIPSLDCVGNLGKREKESMEEQQIRAVVERVLQQLQRPSPGPTCGLAPQTSPLYQPGSKATAGAGAFPEVDQAVQAAGEGFKALSRHTLADRERFIRAIRETARTHAPEIAKETVAETGMGRVEDKIVKIQGVADRTPGTEDLHPIAYTGDQGLSVVEMAPFGVICAITPTTNPAPTIFNNTISMVSAGNAVVFGPHPGAKGVSRRAVELINEAVQRAGGPPNVVTILAEPSIERANALLSHPAIRLNVVTGGPGVVSAAQQAGKKYIAAGPGNPPVVVDETALIPQAAREIVFGASFDNNILCVAEKEVFVVDRVADQLLAEMERAGAYRLPPSSLDALTRLVIAEDHGPGKHSVVNKECIGKDASVILGRIGLNVPPETRLVILETAVEHPLVWSEQMMPVLPIVRVPDVDRAIELALQAEHGFLHTSLMHSLNLEKLDKMAKLVNTTLFVKNGHSLSGEGPITYTIATPTGEGFTTAQTFTRRRRCALVNYFRIV